MEKPKEQQSLGEVRPQLTQLTGIGRDEKSIFNGLLISRSGEELKAGLVVVSELGDEHRIVAYLVDEAMLIINSPGPVAG